MASGGGLQRDFAARRLWWARPVDTVPTQHCGPGPGAERAHSDLGDAVCLNRSAPGSGMTDRTAPGEPRAQGKARLGEEGGAE